MKSNESTSVGPYAIAHAGMTRRKRKQIKKVSVQCKTGLRYVVYCPDCSRGVTWNKWEATAPYRIMITPGSRKATHGKCGLTFELV